MKKLILSLLTIFTMGMAANAQNNNHVSLGVGLLYENSADVTLSYEHETKYHNAGDYFGIACIKWDECASCGHICPESFWKNYRTWSLGIAYKPCVTRMRNSHGNLRIGGSLGSDTDKFLAGIHVGYEQKYSLRGGWKIYWQIKSDCMIKGQDLFRTGIAIGIKLPTGN